MKWHPETVLEQVPELDFAQLDSPLPPEVKAYQEFYGLDLEAQFNGLTHTVGKQQHGEFNIVFHVFKLQNAKGTVYLQHGYYDHVGLYNHLIEHCLQQGFSVFTYDLPGHGLSSGERAAIQSFQQYDEVFCAGLAMIQQYMPGPIIAMGQSTGGAVIINYLLSRGLTRYTSPFEKIFLLAPLVRPVNWNRSVMFYYLARPFVKQMKRTFAENSNNLEFLKFLSEEDPLQPLFLKTSWVGALHKWIQFIENCAPVDLDVTVIQGTEDGTVDYRHNMKVLEEKFSGFSVRFIENGRHHLVNEEMQKLEQVFQFLTPIHETG